MAARPLDAIPRGGLGHWPTPLERCGRLRDALGGPDRCPDIWIKRDDCSGLGLGGNKVRKLDFLLGQAMADGADVVLTRGALQSNHARQTAAACNRLGIGCELVLTTMVDRHDPLYESSGNVLVNQLLGATVHVVPTAEAAMALLAERYDALTAAGLGVFDIPFGGSDPLGTLGYVAATEEWAGQAARVGLGFGVDRVIMACSTGGTYAGTLVGVKRSGLKAHVTGICVYADAATTEAVIKPLLIGAAEMLGIGAPPDALIDVTDEFLGDGYGIPTSGMTEALALFARTEGLILDPVYSGKAAAGLIALIRRGDIPPSERVLFIHTGGSPGLFAYGPEVVAPPD
jgi:D-cysteine desulfhydrase family pyridoxal phosphate-dependent enzyme